MEGLIGKRQMSEIKINKINISKEFEDIFKKYEKIHVLKEASDEALSLQIMNSKPTTSQFLNKILDAEGIMELTPSDLITELQERVKNEYESKLKKQKALQAIQEEKALEDEGEDLQEYDEGGDLAG